MAAAAARQRKWRSSRHWLLRLPVAVVLQALAAHSGTKLQKSGINSALLEFCIKNFFQEELHTFYTKFSDTVSIATCIYGY